MGLMQYTNPFAAALGGFNEGWDKGTAQRLEQEKMLADRKMQEELLGFKRAEAQRAAQQATLEQQASSTLRDRIAATQDRPIQTGLLSMGDMKGMSMLPQQSMPQVVDTSAMKQPVLAGQPMSQQDWMQHAAQYAGTPTSATALQIGAAMQKEKSPAQQLMENVLKDPSKFDDKTVAVVSQLMGAPVGAYRKPEAPQYKERSYVKDNKHITEVSDDGGNTWTLLAEANRYKPDSRQSSVVVTPYLSDNGIPLLLDKGKRQLVEANVAGGGQVVKQAPASVAPKLAANDVALSKARRAMELVNGNMGAFGMQNYVPDAVSQRANPQGVEARAAVADLGSLVLHERSGTAVTAAEIPRLKPFIPNIQVDSPATIAKKTKRFMEIAAEEDAAYRKALKDTGYAVKDTAGNKPKPMSELPPASTLKGRTITRSDGIKLVSDGTKWNIKR